MPKPLVVIISGAPAAGKTTLGRRLARDVRLPYLGKDDIKESLFDSLGTGDRDWSRRLGVATYLLLYQLCETLLEASVSFIVESNFRAEYSTERFRALRERFGFEPVQILCRAERSVLLERYRKRGESGERHAGHLDAILHAELTATMGDDDYTFMDIGGLQVTADTTDLARVDYKSILDAVRSAEKVALR